MAKPLLEALTLIMEKELADLPFRPYTMLGLLRKNRAIQNEIKWNVNVGGASSSGRATTADVGNDDDSDTAKKASLSIGDRVINHTFSLLKTEIVQTRTGGIPALKDLFGNEMRTGFDVILPQLNSTLFTGLGAANNTDHGVVGLAGIIDNTAAYAGIDPATDPLWVSTVFDNGGIGRVLTADIFRNLEIALERKGVVYDIILTTPEIVQVYGKVFALDRSLTVAQTRPVADLSFSGYNWGGRPLMSDTQCPDGHIYFLNSRDLSVYTYDLSGAQNEMTATTRLENSRGLQFMIAQLPNQNPHTMKFEISVIPQFKCHNRKSVGLVSDVDQSLANYS